STPSQRLLGETCNHAECDVGDIACLLSGGNRACLRSLTARPLALPLRQCAAVPEVEVDPLSWSSSGFKRRLFRCPRRVRPIHLSFVARWSIWFALDVIRPSLPASSSRQRSPSATGLRKPTGTRAAGRVAG